MPARSSQELLIRTCARSCKGLGQNFKIHQALHKIFSKDLYKALAKIFKYYG